MHAEEGGGELDLEATTRDQDGHVLEGDNATADTGGRVSLGQDSLHELLGSLNGDGLVG